MSRVLSSLSISNLSFFFFFFFFFFCVLVVAGDVIDDGSRIIISSSTSSEPSRLDFPPGFVFGAGTSAYQVEGAAAEDGRKPSIWDTFTHEGKSLDKCTGDIASNQYHKYKHDVKLMHKMGLDAYRFSISWSRLIPDGHGAVNPKGLKYYNNLINELLRYGIEPHVTLVHYDNPQALEDDYEGYLSPKFIEDFTAYADVCFKEYGDRVKWWMTFNEANMQTVTGNGWGLTPPGRCSTDLFGANCTKVNSTTEPYVGAHNIILSHSAAVHLYRTKYQEKQKGKIGITLSGFWFEPIDNSSKNIAASKRALDFHIGWFLGPLVYGRYPAIMRKNAGSKLPKFSENESKQLMGSYDFIGINHYNGFFVADAPDKIGNDYYGDAAITITSTNGLSLRDFIIREAVGTSIDERGLQRVLEYITLKYKNPTIFIHENGYSEGSSSSTNYNDSERIKYLQRYIGSLPPTIRNGSNVVGYFVWSFLDVFEILGGYTRHFGLYRVDFSDKYRKRYLRQSVQWYSNFLAKNGRMSEIANF